MDGKIYLSNVNIEFSARRMNGRRRKVGDVIRGAASILKEVDSFVSANPDEALGAVKQNAYVAKSLGHRADYELAKREGKPLVGRLTKTVQKNPELSPSNIVEEFIKTATMYVEGKK